MDIVVVGIGSAFGAITRYLISKLMNKKYDARFPLATFIINILGALFIGIISGLSINALFTLFLTTGFMGGFTTFSTFNVDSIKLLKNKDYKIFLLYVISTYTLGLILFYFGYSLLPI